ncbi:glycosyltransferase family 39 protein [Polycladidibacter stylochi]|uniref:glycosyltransferase family 39 protein n=1 Tax=Polycladidibacter stylochi TaxID=1807766 RepID=UPI00082EA6BF|nr:glycosyltransferase family 39 protein [Pseudovibrio stylochi]
MLTYITKTSAALGLLQRAKNAPIIMLVAIALAHTVLWGSAAYFLSGNLPLDAVESFYWGKELQLGYFKHPPVSAWIAELAVRIFGRHDLLVFWLATGCSSAAILPLGLYINRRYGYRVAIYTSLTALLTHFTTLSAVEYNVNMGFVPFWSLMLVAFLKAQENKGLFWWIVFGVISASGIMAKYMAGLLLVAITLWVLLARRDILKQLGPYLAAGVFALLLIPHILWLISVDFLPISYALSRSNADSSFFYKHGLQPVKFLIEFIYSIAPMLIAAGCALGWSRIKLLFSLKEGAEVRSKIWAICQRPICAIALLSIFVIFMLSLVAGAKIKTIWSMPLGIVFSVVIGSVIASLEKEQTAKRFEALWLSLYSLLLVIFIAIMLIAPLVKKYPKRMLHDGPALTEIALEYWQRYTKKPLEYIVGDHWPGGTVAWYAPSRPTMFEAASKVFSPWVNEKDLAQKGGLYVSYIPVKDGDVMAGLCIEHSKQMLWPAKYGKIYQKHPQIWLAIMVPLPTSNKCSVTE